MIFKKINGFRNKENGVLQFWRNGELELDEKITI
jgi:hypothetical protein